MINNINNGESGLSARNKINQIINTVNLGITTGATLIGDVIYFNTNDEQNAYSVDLSSLSPSGADGITTGATLIGEVLSFNTNNQQNAYSVDLSSLSTTVTGITTGATLIGEVLSFNTTEQQNAYSVDLSSLSTTVTGITTSAVLSGNTLYFNTTEQQNAYSADLGGLRSYSDLGFTIITTSATTLNQSVVLPEGVVVTYNSPLIVGPGVTVTVPESTTLIIVTGSTY